MRVLVVVADPPALGILADESLVGGTSMPVCGEAVARSALGSHLTASRFCCAATWLPLGASRKASTPYRPSRTRVSSNRLLGRC